MLTAPTTWALATKNTWTPPATNSSAVAHVGVGLLEFTQAPLWTMKVIRNGGQEINFQGGRGFGTGIFGTINFRIPV